MTTPELVAAQIEQRRKEREALEEEIEVTALALYDLLTEEGYTKVSKTRCLRVARKAARLMRRLSVTQEEKK